MNYIQKMKCLGKYAVVLALAVALRPFLDTVIILKFHLGPFLETWLGRNGLIFMMAIEIIGIPALLAATVIGILGGLLIGGKVINGFVLSLAIYLFEFVIGITTHGLRFDWITFLSLLGLIVVPAFGALIYGIFSKRCIGSAVSQH